MKKYSVVIIISILFLFVVTEGICGEKADYVRTMQENLVKVDSEYYSLEDLFDNIGSVVVKGSYVVHVGYNNHLWGINNNRGTLRLVLFDKDFIPLGEYGHVDAQPIGVKNKSTVVFDCEKEWGNKIDFKDGIPPQIWVDGHIHDIEIYNEKIKSLLKKELQKRK